MFVLSEIEDTVEISASSKDKQIAVMDKLKMKYTGKLVDNLGISLFVKEIIEIAEYEIQSEHLIANVIFDVVFYRFYEDEVVFGKIIKQEEEKITIEDDLGSIYEVHAINLFENCEFDNVGDNNRWIWNYKGNQLPFTTGGIVRLKINKLNYKDSVVDAAMNDQGLGHVLWWD